MFKKLLSNLPFNPSLLGQVSFYSARLKRESFVRGAGIITIALALLIQTFAVITPPERSLAQGANDIIPGGFGKREDAVMYCLDGTKDVSKIFQYYGLNCDIIASATTRYLKSTDYEKGLDSLGRVPQPANNPKNGKPSDQYNVNIPGVDQLYMKNLWYWDSGASSSYKVLEMTNIYGQTIFIMYDCGNIVTTTPYSPPVAEVTPEPTPIPTPTPEEKVSLTPVSKPVELVETPDVCLNIPGTQTNVNQCYPCPAAQTNGTPTACLTFTKTARNDTRNLPDANNTVAKPADVITYTLSAKNTGLTDLKDFVFEENLIDVLQYSDMNDYGGATLSVSKHLVWPKRTIAAGTTATVQFSVKVMSPIPKTPVPVSDPGSYDLCMTNVFFGQTVRVCVEPPTNKQIETVATTLPNTGPGESLLIGFVVVTLMGYFFARNKLMAEELDIVRHEYASGSMA